MTARIKIDLHVGTLSIEFGDTSLQFNIFEPMKHPTKDHSLFVIDLILATIFTAEDKSAKGSRDQERTKVISAKKTIFKADLHVQTDAETNSAKEDQKQAEAESISDVQGKNCIPSGSDFKAEQRAEFDFHLTRKMSRPQ
ncbi:hypothetical protein CR513_32287, partial [Mucuna pruriens]